MTWVMPIAVQLAGDLCGGNRGGITMPNIRGTYDFEVGGSNLLIDNAGNLEKLRRLFRDGSIIENDWGPGNRGDFDHGSWHILCHLAGGSGVITAPSGRGWCGITHIASNDTYNATITYRHQGAARTLSLTSP